jgi:hypothetical protein
MQTISPEAETKLIASVKEAVSLVDDQNMAPDDAFTKIAQENKWGADMIKFAAHAYNTGRQLSQMETSDSILDKLAEFPLADPDIVIGRVFPETVKTAAQQDHEKISPEYRLPPSWLPAQERQHQLKVASAPLPAIDAALPIPPDPMEKMAKAHSQYNWLKRAAEEARYQESVAHDSLLASVGQLGDYFKQFPSDRVKFADVDHAAKTYHGSAGAWLMDYAYKRNAMKEARASDVPPSVEAVDWTAGPFKLLKQCLDRGVQLKQKRAEFDAAAEALEKFGRETLNPFVSAPCIETAAEFSTSLLPEAPMTKKAAQPGWGGIGDAARKTTNILMRAHQTAPGPQEEFDRNKALHSQWLELEDPDHDSQLKAIRAQTVMADLMNDDIIGGYDTDEVMKAYNEIAQMAPRSAMQPIAIRSMLRRYLTGEMAPFETKDIADTEKTLGETQSHGPDIGTMLFPRALELQIPKTPPPTTESSTGQTRKDSGHREQAK